MTQSSGYLQKIYKLLQGIHHL